MLEDNGKLNREFETQGYQKVLLPLTHLLSCLIHILIEYGYCLTAASVKRLLYSDSEKTEMLFTCQALHLGSDGKKVVTYKAITKGSSSAKQQRKKPPPRLSYQTKHCQNKEGFIPTGDGGERVGWYI